MALDLIVRHGIPRSSRCIDLGARHGVILCWLAKMGFRNLWGCDLRYPFPPLKSWLKTGHLSAVLQASAWIASGRLKLSRQDLCRTQYPDSSFDFVTCLSVIEHIPDSADALREIRRILKPGGLALISTDYWEAPLDTSGMVVCGQPAKIYDRTTIEHDLIRIASQHGLKLCGPVDLRIHEPLVSFMGLEYTFIFLQFRAEG